MHGITQKFWEDDVLKELRKIKSICSYPTVLYPKSTQVNYNLKIYYERLPTGREILLT